MFDVQSMDWKNDVCWVVKPQGHSIVSPILMQFTGLLDKNGKEIYEGDILKVRKELVGMFPVNDLENDFNIVCKYRGASFYPLELVGENSVEIIGNIYQNNDLLK